MSGATFRVIARLDVKDEHLVKGVQYEGLRKLGDPHAFAARYYAQGADELLYLDTVASLYGRSHLDGILQATARDVRMTTCWRRVRAECRSSNTSSRILHTASSAFPRGLSSLRSTALRRLAISCTAIRNSTCWEKRS